MANTAILILALCEAHKPQSRGMTVPEPPGSAAILAASGAGETPALPGKACSEVLYGAFLCKIRTAVANTPGIANAAGSV